MELSTKGLRPASFPNFFITLLLNKLELVLVESRTVRVFISDRQIGPLGLCPRPEAIFKATNYGFHKPLVGVIPEILFEHLNLDRCSYLKQMRVLFDRLERNFIREFIGRRTWQWGSKFRGERRRGTGMTGLSPNETLIKGRCSRVGAAN
jgi:hypothetical protein